MKELMDRSPRRTPIVKNGCETRPKGHLRADWSNVEGGHVMRIVCSDWIIGFIASCLDISWRPLQFQFLHICRNVTSLLCRRIVLEEIRSLWQQHNIFRVPRQQQRTTELLALQCENQAWLRSIEKKFLCDKHFSPATYKTLRNGANSTKTNRKRLLPNAVPSMEWDSALPTPELMLSD